ncbi:MAG TPA: hypothetical protein VIM98_13080 [Dyella sp.]|uniref:hypothetical protein n=1 Tax=Dyella sp. TaxID=1869338 RepID=UPI002F943FCD
MSGMAWMVLAGVLAATGADDSAQTIVEGKLTVSDGSERPAQLVVMCTPGSAGVLSLQLQLLDVRRLNFDLDGFDGLPTASQSGSRRGKPAAATNNTHLRAGAQEAAVATRGWYGGDTTKVPYTFSVSQAAGQKGPLIAIVTALSTAGNELAWTQNPARTNSGQPLVAHFVPDVNQTYAIAQEIKPCLPVPEAPAKAGRKRSRAKG